MSLNEDFENRKEQKEKKKVWREKIASYFFDLSKLAFAALVLGAIPPIFNEEAPASKLVTVLLGVFIAFAFAILGNKILKS